MEWTRRRMVGATVTATAAALAGCLGEDSGDESDDESSDGDRDAEAVLEEYELEDLTGRESVDVTVDPDGNGFEPEAFVIDTDTIINWQWEGSSVGLYPIDIPDECFWDEEDNEDDEWVAGDEYDRLFWAPGAYVYGSRDDGEEFTGAFRVREAEDGGERDNETENETESTDENDTEDEQHDEDDSGTGMRLG